MPVKEDVRAALFDLLGQKHDASGTPATTGLIHGPGGVWSYPGVDPDVFSTVVGTLPGVLSVIPAVPSLYEHPTYEVWTGVLAGSGAEPTNVCDDAPVGGTLKGGIVTAPFGRYQRATREIDLTRIGQRVDRAEPMDLRLVNSPIGRTAITSGETEGLQILVNEIDAAMYERAVEYHRLLSRQAWTGNPANNTAGGGYKEFAGLDLLVNTGWKDAETGVALPSLVPDIKAFNYAKVDTNGDALVNALTYMARYVRDKASRQRLNARWAFFMREELFYEVTKVWPCAYFTNLCSVDSNGAMRQNVDVGDQIAMRDDMRTNQYLIVDGRRFDVVFDDGIPEHSNTTDANVTSGCFSSDIYLLPLAANGRATLYLEYFEFRNADVLRALGQSGVGNEVQIVGDGKYMETFSRTNWCLKWQSITRPRLVLRAPWLAGRLTDVQYCPLQHTAQPFPEDPYFQNGGATTRSGPSLYNPWN